METLTKKLQRKISEKTLFFGLLAVLVIVLVPMLIMAGYDVPHSDDFLPAAQHQAWEQSHSIMAVLSICVQMTVDIYFVWQGPFAGVFVSLLPPSVFGEQWYFLTPYVMLCSLFGGSFYLLWAVFHKLLGLSGWKTGTVWIVFAAAATQLLPGATEAFYWWSGAALYTFVFGVVLILYGKLALALFGGRGASKGRRTADLLCMVFLAAAAGGGNFAEALLTAMLYAIAIAVMLWTGRGDKIKILVSGAVFFLSFAAMLLAPGNANRRSGEPNAAAAIWSSLRYGLQSAREWLTPLLLCLMALLIPLLWQLAGDIKYRFRCPYIIALGSFGLYAAMFCPYFYAGHTVVPWRYLDEVYYAFVLLLILNLFYGLGWLRKTLGGGEEKGRYSVSFLLLWGCAFAGAFLLTFREQTITSYRAASELVHGNAANYRMINEERFALLKDPTKKEVTLPRYYNPAAYTVYTDMWNMEPVESMKMADYYGKDAIYLDEWEPGRL